MASGAASPASGGMSEGSGTILLVEDNPAYIRLVRELLTEAGLDGFELEWADLLEKGVDRLDAGGIDLVLLDLLLPDNMGTNTLQVVLERTEDVPVVVLTGIEDDELAREALELGAVDYLCKGRLDADRLARSVRYALEEATGGPATVQPNAIDTDRVLPVAADRLEAAAACFDAVKDHLDPLAPGETEAQLSGEQTRCQTVAEGLREIVGVVEDGGRRERLSLHEVVDDAIVRLSADGPAGGRVTLTWSKPPQVLGDRQQLVRLFELLLAQLLRRPDDETAHVEVSAVPSGDRWEIRLEDDAAMPKAPDPVGQLFASSVDQPRLTGALARTLCEAVAAGHGGRLWIEPDESDGAVLAVSLPTASATATPSEARARPDGHRKTL